MRGNKITKENIMPRKDTKIVGSVIFTLLVMSTPFALDYWQVLSLQNQPWWLLMCVSVFITALNVWAHEDKINIILSALMWVLSGMTLYMVLEQMGMCCKIYSLKEHIYFFLLFFPLFGAGTSVAAMMLRTAVKSL